MLMTIFKHPTDATGSDDCFEFFFVPTPPEDTRAQFVQIARPLFESISRYATQNALLAQTRALLLPRLISGRLPVEHLEVQFPSSMQGEAGESEPAHA